MSHCHISVGRLVGLLFNEYEILVDFLADVDISHPIHNIKAKEAEREEDSGVLINDARPLAALYGLTRPIVQHRVCAASVWLRRCSM